MLITDNTNSLALSVAGVFGTVGNGDSSNKIINIGESLVRQSLRSSARVL